jgi:transcriptional regulator
MYNLPHFKAENENEVISFMQTNPFIILCGIDENNKPVATHVPVLFRFDDDKIILEAHVMRNQEHTRAFEKNNNVLCVFSSAHSYVSASWYKEKNVASTWNYEAVHANGILKFVDDEALLSLLIKLTEKFENNPDSLAHVKNMTHEYVKENMKAIVAFEIELTSIHHVFKLSQNKDSETYHSIKEHLSNGDNSSKYIAERMKNNNE